MSEMSHVDQYGFRHQFDEDENLALHYLCQQLHQHHGARRAVNHSSISRWRHLLAATPSPLLLPSINKVTHTLDTTITWDTTRCGAGRICGAHRYWTLDHVIDPHFVTFSSSLYTTIRNHKPNRNPTVTTDRQIGPRDSQIVTVQIRPTDPSRSAFCRMPYYIRALVTAISVTNRY